MPKFKKGVQDKTLINDNEDLKDEKKSNEKLCCKNKQ